MAFEYWYCEACKRDGCVRHQKRASVFEVAEKIGVQHRVRAPQCAETNGRAKVSIGRQHVPKIRFLRVR